MTVQKAAQVAYNLTTAILIACLAAFASYSFLSSDQNWHHAIIEARIVPSEISSGDPIGTYVKIDRLVPENCSLTLHRFITVWDTGVVIWSQIAPGVARSAGVQEIKRLVDVIPPLHPGDYGYSFRVVTDCGKTVLAPVESKVTKFTVVNH